MICQSCAKLFYWICQIQFIIVLLSATFSRHLLLVKQIRGKYSICKHQVSNIQVEQMRNQKQKYAGYNQKILIKYQWMKWYWKNLL